MFFINSDDKSIIPDSLFFLHKIELVHFQKTEMLSQDELFLIENGVFQKVYTLDTIDEKAMSSETIIIFNFVNNSDLSKLRGHNILFIPHVYFDYFTSIKNILLRPEFNSFKIYAPEINTTLVPKKHLKIILPFLKETDFVPVSKKIKPVEKQEIVKISFSLIFHLSAQKIFCMVLNLYRYTCYPARKLYWIAEHEFHKRIVKAFNVSKH